MVLMMNGASVDSRETKPTLQRELSLGANANFSTTFTWSGLANSWLSSFLFMPQGAQ